MSERRLFLDESIGERRGVVTLNGRPERLIIDRDEDAQPLSPGARLRARVRKVDTSLGCAFVDAGVGEAMLDFRPDARPVEGQTLEVQIRSEPRGGKLAVARVIGLAEGAPGLLAAAPDLVERLAGFAKQAEIIRGTPAREIADEAEAEALGTVHALPGGGNLAIEPTRALTAVDVDVGERKGQDAKRVTRQANLAALGMCARLLRLKGLGGLIVIDLVGRGHDANALMGAARAAFAPDNPGVSIGPVGRFGTIELIVPRRARPISEVLLGEDGSLSVRSLAQRLIRRLEAEAVAQPGSRLVASCAPAVAAAATPLTESLARRFGARFEIRAISELAPRRFEVSAA